MQALTHEIRNGVATFYGRAPDGSAVTCTVPNFRTVWVRDAYLKGPQGATVDVVPRQGRSLLSTDTVTQFSEYWITGKTPRKDLGASGWYNRRLGAVESFYARENVPPLTWFTRTSFARDDDMARAADRANTSWAPFRLLVFDMECLPKADGGFPQASDDAIIQISVVFDYDLLQGKTAAYHLWTWRATALVQVDEFDPAGCAVHELPSEKAMLLDFVQFVAREDPDIISGWNVQGFDLPYLMRRCERLGVPCRIGRGNRAASMARNDAIVIHGRVVADLLLMWRAQHKERSYKLDAVASHHLGASKAPVHYSEMRRLWDQDRGPLATYCLKDSYLVWRLGATRNMWMNAYQMAKVTFVPLDRIVNGGQQIRVFTLLTHFAHMSCTFIPDTVPLCDTGYKGAVVLSPKPGFYQDCVVTLDFASLYPSIMMAFNMCYTTQRTQVSEWELARSLRLPVGVAAHIMKFVTVPTGAVPADARKYHRCGSADFQRKPRGILPQILETLLKRRKVAKREMAQASGLQKAIANGRQLALKLVANSIYGFTGAAELGMLPQPQIAAAVTHMGRKLTLGTKAICEREEGVTCVYGDTDSVFLCLKGVRDIHEASRRAEALARTVDAVIPKPNCLEFEKVYRPLLLRGKKRYCGRKYEEGKGDGELDTKGFEMVRRDNFPLLPDVQQRAMHELVMNDDVAAADNVVRQTLVQLLTTPVPHDLTPFTIAKELTKAPEQYAVAPPHVCVARKMTPAPAIRDRVPYVVTRGAGGIGDRALHPNDFARGTHELDIEWYTDQITRCMRRVLELSSHDVDAVFAPVAGTITATGSSGIMRALGAPETLVWRHTRRKESSARPAKRPKQMDLRRYF